MPMVIALEAYTLPSGPVVTLLFTDGEGFTTAPTDTPPNTVVWPRLEEPFIDRQDMFEKATTYGTVDVGPGQAVINNADGFFDYLRSTYAFDGRSFKAYSSDENGAFPASYTLVGSKAIQHMQPGDFQFIVKLRDNLVKLKKPLLPNKYLGNNSLPNGVEGTADDLKGKPKPRPYGTVQNVTPDLVNTSKLIFQFSDQLASITAVYDKQAGLTAGSSYSDMTDMMNNAPSANNYRVLATASGTYFRLGSPPDGLITCYGGTTETKAASLISQVAQDMGISSGNINASSISALNTKNSTPVGVYVRGETTALDVMIELSNSIGAWFNFDNLDDMYVGRLELPSGSPVVSIIKERVLELGEITTSDENEGIPPWQVRLDYSKIWTVQTDIAGSASARKAIVENEYRRVTRDDTSVLTAHLLSEPMVFQSTIIDETAAGTEAQRRLDIYKTDPRMYQGDFQLEDSDVALIKIGVEVEVFYDRYELDSGKTFVVVGREYDASTKNLTLRLWG